MRLDLRDRLAGLLVFIGLAEFMILMIVAEAIYPGYSVSHNYISDLGNYRLAPSAPHALIFNSAIIVMGALLVIGAILFVGGSKTRNLLRAFMILTGIGAAGVGVFTETSPYHLHDIFSLITFLFASLDSYPASVFRGRWSAPWAVLGTIALVALGLYIPGQYLGLGWGGMERMIVYPNIIWALGFSGSLMAQGGRNI